MNNKIRKQIRNLFSSYRLSFQELDRDAFIGELETFTCKKAQADARQVTAMGDRFQTGSRVSAVIGQLEQKREEYFQDWLFHSTCASKQLRHALASNNFVLLIVLCSAPVAARPPEPTCAEDTVPEHAVVVLVDFTDKMDGTASIPCTIIVTNSRRVTGLLCTRCGRRRRIRMLHWTSFSAPANRSQRKL